MNTDISRRELLTLLGAATTSGLLSACTPGTTPPADIPEAKGPLHFTTLQAVARLIESRDISPVDLTQMMLDRIAEVDSRLLSYATVTADRALAAAHKAEREISAGNYRGQLHGIPVAVKDLCFTKGTRTMGGLAVFRNFVPEFDATVITRLEKAGAVLLGKLNLTEGAMAGYHPDFDIPVNPWGDELWAGASSSGSGVATAAGLCFASLGTDTGGSIRFPSMANGIVGLKPTYGRVSRYGVLPLGETLDHVGPMTRSTADAAIMFEAIAGYDANDPTSLREPVPDMLADLDSGIDDVRIGFDRQYAFEGTDPGLVVAIERALDVLKGLGAKVVDINMPDDAAGVPNIWFPICTFEAHQAHATNFQMHPDAYGPYFSDFLETGAAVTDEQYAAANQQRIEFSERYEAALAKVDAVVCPSGGFTFPVARDMQYGDAADLASLFAAVQMQFTIPADFAGTPTLTAPCGFSDAGVPYAIQFLGKRLTEASLCRVGHAYEQATEWHKRHPSV
jgi:amidase